jgi:hypothetical protein
MDAYGQPIPYDSYQEFILDRIAANYVSFTILDDNEIRAFQEGGSSSSAQGKRDGLSNSSKFRQKDW